MSGYKIKFNGIDRLYLRYKEELDVAVQRVYKSGKHILGIETEQLENNIAKKYFRKYAVAVGSATDGLYFALRAGGITESDTVFCPVLSYVATAGAIKRTEAKIHFHDTDNYGNIGILDEKIKPKAIMCVNLFGNVADFNRLKNYCEKNQVLLIEDAAQSQGAYYKDIPSGKLGDISVFSFDPMKNMPCFGSGGMVLTDDESMYQRIRSLRRHAIEGNFYEYGYNSVIPEDHAAQLNVLLNHYDELQEERQRVVDRYYLNMPNKIFIKTNKENKSSNHKLIILTEHRDQLNTHLKEKDIECKIHYKELLDNNNKDLYPTARALSKRSISLPIYPFLKNEEIDYICNNIEDFYGI
jgi:dTDP-4-amino-4,6-dideoxygalactose transaminase